MKEQTRNSLHELAHYYQCRGAVILSQGRDIDKAQEYITKAMQMYLRDRDNDEPYFSLFDNYRCIAVNLLLQAIIDNLQGNEYIGYRKLLYCREWVSKYRFSIHASGISEISTMLVQKDIGWVFSLVFPNSNNIDAILYDPHFDQNILLSVLKEELSFKSLCTSTIESSLKAFAPDYLLLNNYPKTHFRKYFFFHLEEIYMKTKRIFIIHGRNLEAYREFISFLTSIGLFPIEWEEAVSLTNKPSPYIGEIIDAGFNEAQAIIVLLTPDEKVELDKRLCKTTEEEKPRLQARPNVIFEAGASLSKYPQQTIIVRMGKQSIWSDIEGIHTITLRNMPESRQKLVSRLKTAGCSINIDNSSLWLYQGNLDICNTL